MNLDSTYVTLVLLGLKMMRQACCLLTILKGLKIYAFLVYTKYGQK